MAINIENEKGLNDILEKVQEDSAMVFMSVPGNSKTKEQSVEPVKKNQSDLNQMKFKKPKEELKDKRFSLLVKPSLYNRLKDLAEEKGTSVNNVINVILESVLEAQKGK